VHTIREFETLLCFNPQIIGVNNRDLKTFEVNLETTEFIAPQLSPEIIRVGESGIHNRDDMIRMENACLDAVLIGEGIITSPEPELKIRELLGKV